MNIDPKLSVGEVLSLLCESGIIEDESDVVAKLNMTKKEQIVQKHPYAISQGKDGRWRTYVSDGTKLNGRRQIAKSTKEKLYDAIVKYYESDEEDKYKGITVTQLFPEWLEYKRLHTNREGTIKRIVNEWKRLYEGTDIVNCPVTSLTKLQLDEWVHHLIKDNGMNRKQYSNASVIMRQLMEYALDRGVISVNPFANVKPDSRMFRKEQKKPSETQVFTKEEEAALEQAAWSDFFNREHHKHQLAPLAVLFMFQTGVRVGEVVALRYEDIEGDELHVQRMCVSFDDNVVNHTKTDAGDRYVYLPEKARTIIAAARQRQREEGVSDKGYIFSMTDGHCPYHTTRKCFYKYCKEIGITAKSSHKARKTYISALLSEGVNINTVREMVGHTDERTTFKSYCFDRLERSERGNLIESALSE